MAFKFKVSEEFLQWVWQNWMGFLNQAPPGIGIEVLSPGSLNKEGGPDFRHSLIKFNDDVIKGDVEVHLLGSDWFRHKHELDPQYNNVILHVVWHQDVQDAITLAKRTIPTLVLSEWGEIHIRGLLRNYYKERRVKKLYKCPHIKNLHRLIEVLMTEGLNRFNYRKQMFSHLVVHEGNDQSAYMGLMESLGYVKNELPFIRLAKLVKIEKIVELTLGKPRNERIKTIKAILLGVADLLSLKYQREWDKIKHEFANTLHREEWQFFKVRPLGFPDRRIEGISYFLADVVEQGIWDFLCSGDFEWIEKKIGGGIPPIGRRCARITILNVCLPIMAVAGNIPENEVIHIYKNYRRLAENYITKQMSQVLHLGKRKLVNEIYYQGMIHIFQNYCHIKRCYECPIKRGKVS